MTNRLPTLPTGQPHVQEARDEIQKADAFLDDLDQLLADTTQGDQQWRERASSSK